MKLLANKRGALAVLALGVAVWAAPAGAQPADNFYAGKRINFIVGSNPGGAYDIWARVMVPYFKQYIPGNPNMIVENRPGGGGLLSSNYIYNVAPKDGTVMALVERGAPMDPVLNGAQSQAKYDPRKFNWIGSPSQEIGIAMVSRNAPIKSFEDFKTHEIMVSSTTRTGLASIYPRVMNGVFGTKFKVIEGYKSSTEMLYALEKGEVAGHIAPSTSGVMRALITPWIEEGSVRVVLQLGQKKDPAFPDAEMLIDLIKKPEDRQLFDLMLVQLNMAYPIALPPDVPKERVAVIRAAFDKMMADADFIAAANKSKLEPRAVTGLELQRMIEQVFDTPQAVLARYNELAQ